jgi:hypothetical protein
VHLEYKDDQYPERSSEERRCSGSWSPSAKLLEPNALPNAANSAPMPADDFDASCAPHAGPLRRPSSIRTTKGRSTRPPISSPFHGAVEVEDFQLVPLLKALRMPRVNLLLADDVGLGKTVEAGLILTSFCCAAASSACLILTPASLRLQWRDEMRDKFSLYRSTSSTATRRTRCGSASGWTPTPGAPSVASSPRTTTSDRTMSRGVPLGLCRPKARPTCRGTC